MAVDEEAPLTGGNYTATERVSLRGSARVFLSALLLFTVSAFSAKSLFPRGRASTTTSQSLATEEEVVLLVEEDAIVVEGEELTTLAPGARRSRVGNLPSCDEVQQSFIISIY